MIMSMHRTLPSRRAFGRAFLVAALGLFSIASRGSAAASLNVVLIAGVKNDAYDNEPSLKRVQAFLEKTYNVTCSWVTPGADGKSLQNLEALEKADAAILLVRRMTVPADQMARIKRFFESGKGFVGLRTASHAWNEWPTFDVDVLGAKYGGHFGPAKSISIKPHPITQGAAAYKTANDIYRYDNLHPEVKVLIDGSNEKGTMPAAWVRERPNGRIFYLGIGHNNEFEKPEFLQMIADGVIWSAGKKPAAYRR